MQLRRTQHWWLARRPVRRRWLGHEALLAWALLLPSLVVVFGIIIYPLLKTLYTSFFDVNSVFPGSYPFVGLRNYRDTFTTPEFWSALQRTAYFTVVSTFAEVILGIALGILLNQKFKGRWFLRSIVILPWALPTVVNGAMWRWIFNAQYGALNALLTQLHLMGAYRSWLGTPALALNMVIVSDVWKMTPLAAFFVLAALQTIPQDLYEAAAVDGAGMLRRFTSITLPLLTPTIVIILVLRTMEAFKVFDIIYVMTRGGPADGTETIAFYTYIQAFSNQLFGLGAAIDIDVGLLSREMEQVRGKSEEVLDTAIDVFGAMASVDFVSRGAGLATAGVGALLLREGARLPACSLDTNQYLHGPIEVAEGGQGCVVVGSGREVQLAQDLASYGMSVLLITDAPVRSAQNLWVVSVKRVPEALAPILEVVPVQLLIHRLAAARGLAADTFRRAQRDTKLEAA